MNKKGLAPLMVIVIVALIIGAGFVGYQSATIKERKVATSIPTTTISTTIITTTKPPVVTTNPSISYKTVWDDGSLWDTLYRSTDGGQHWVAIDRQYKAKIIYAFDPKNPNTIYDAKTGFNMMGEDIDSVNLVKSTDGGKTWKNISDALKKMLGAKAFYNFSLLRIDPNNSDIVYVSTSIYSPGTDKDGQGVNLKSTDGGNTWVILPSGGPG